MNGYHLLPFDPGFAANGAAINASVWNGTTDGSSAGVGGGFLTEFEQYKKNRTAASRTGNAFRR